MKERRGAAGGQGVQALLLTPVVGAICMSASTVVVALNAQLRKRADL